MNRDDFAPFFPTAANPTWAEPAVPAESPYISVANNYGPTAVLVFFTEDVFAIDPTGWVFTEDGVPNEILSWTFSSATDYDILLADATGDGEKFLSYTAPPGTTTLGDGSIALPSFTHHPVVVL